MYIRGPREEIFPSRKVPLPAHEWCAVVFKISIPKKAFAETQNARNFAVRAVHMKTIPADESCSRQVLFACKTIRPYWPRTPGICDPAV